MSGVSLMSAVRALLVSDWGMVSGRVFRDKAPTTGSGPTTPYITFFELPASAAVSGDAKITAWNRGGQVSLWQRTDSEDRALVASLLRELNGAKLSLPGAAIYGCAVTDSTRLFDPSTEFVQDAITLKLSHDGTAQ